MAAPQEPFRRGSVNVLAVDDEPAACKLLALNLAAPGIRCTTANSGEEALLALQREHFDAVISDLQMPGLGGMELLREVRRRYPHTVFVITTGVDQVDVGIRALHSGADDYLVKPLQDQAVLVSLDRALHHQRVERELENYRQHLEEMVAERSEQLKNALQQIECSYEDTLRALGSAIDLRDHETGGHSRRVCLYSLEIARAMGWSEKDLKDLARGSYLHDIGKLGIPDSVLLKPGPLTAGERMVMQQHARIGYDIIKGIPFLADAAEIILMHHEHYDGGGYPRGLAGSAILGAARIFAVADALDAITSDRPYRRGSSFEQAREILRLAAGGQFDPGVVGVFLGLPEGTWAGIAKDSARSGNLPVNFRDGDIALRRTPLPKS